MSDQSDYLNSYHRFYPAMESSYCTNHAITTIPMDDVDTKSFPNIKTPQCPPFRTPYFSMTMVSISFLFQCYSLYHLHQMSIILSLIILMISIWCCRGTQSFWTKCTYCIALLYISLLSSIIILPDIDNMRFAMTLFDGTLNREIPIPPSHLTDCANVSRINLGSVFSHFLWWIVLTLFTRNRMLSWMMSIHWKMVEGFSSTISDHPYLRGLQECWCDSIFFDVFVCDLLGIEVGMLLIRTFGLQPFHWSTMLNSTSYSFRSLLDLVDTTEITKNGVALLEILMICSIIPFNALMLKGYLWIPPWHWLNAARSLVVMLSCCQSTKKVYNRFFREKSIESDSFLLFVPFIVAGLECAIVGRFIVEDTEMNVVELVQIWGYPWLIVLVFSCFLCIRVDSPSPSRNVDFEKRSYFRVTFPFSMMEMIQIMDSRPR